MQQPRQRHNSQQLFAIDVPHSAPTVTSTSSTTAGNSSRSDVHELLFGHDSSSSCDDTNSSFMRRRSGSTDANQKRRRPGGFAATALARLPTWLSLRARTKSLGAALPFKSAAAAAAYKSSSTISHRNVHQLSHRLRQRSITRVVVLAVAVVALFAALTLGLLEGLGRLRFVGFLASTTTTSENTQLGFYHEMDIDMQQLRDATHRPHGMLFPAGTANTHREVAAWVSERRGRTNGRKFLVGCTDDWRGYVLRSFLHLFTDLKASYDWTDFDVTIDPVGFFYKQDPNQAPSVLLFCLNSFHYPMALLLEHAAYFQELRALGTLIMVWNDDLHYYDQFDPLQLRNKILTKADVLVGSYAYNMDEYFASVTHDHVALRDLPLTLWLPHSAGPDFTQFGFNDAPIRKVVLSGARGSNWYPLRHWLTTYQQTHTALIDNYEHAGHYVADNTSTIYATYLRAYAAGVTTTLLFQFLVAKVFEIPATGSLLVVNNDTSSLLASLGFVDRTHFVAFDRTDPVQTLAWVTDPANRVEVDRIRRAGMDHVRAQHLVAHRVTALDAFVTHGTTTYDVPPTYQLTGPCPSIALPSIDECKKRFQREAFYKCDMWYCGVRSLFR